MQISVCRAQIEMHSVFGNLHSATERTITLHQYRRAAPMRYLTLSALALAAGLSLLSADDQGVDNVTKQATQLEAELSKLRSTTGEAADVMLKLSDLYYQSGRVFGLIRVGQSFVALHTSHPKHKDVMLKLIDGLLVTGRNKEVIATGRQFLVRYPQDPSCV